MSENTCINGTPHRVGDYFDAESEEVAVHWCKTCGAIRYTLKASERHIGGINRRIPGCTFDWQLPHVSQTLLQESVLTIAEKTLADNGEKIPAIKAIRQRTGLGLKEAMEKYDAYINSKGRLI
jgi:hypothetical protein